jgi:hypothetical protein
MPAFWQSNWVIGGPNRLQRITCSVPAAADQHHSAVFAGKETPDSVPSGVVHQGSLAVPDRLMDPAMHARIVSPDRHPGGSPNLFY